ncbi:hypothetical protein TNCV_4255121 [Trichonephila clavipes]|nr:hypothetical protein TNCV_4255121 [Trichonephila clavipes]
MIPAMVAEKNSMAELRLWKAKVHEYKVRSHGLPLVSAKIHYQIGDGGSFADPYPCDMKKRVREERLEANRIANSD